LRGAVLNKFFGLSMMEHPLIAMTSNDTGNN